MDDFTLVYDKETGLVTLTDSTTSAVTVFTSTDATTPTALTVTSVVVGFSDGTSQTVPTPAA